MQPSKLAVYGILKKGFSLDLGQFPDTKFLNDGFIQGAQLHAIHGGVGLRFIGDPLEVAYVEIWDIPDGLWDYLDEIESNGRVYTRKVVKAIVEHDSRLREHECWVYEHTMLKDQEEYMLRYSKIENGRFEGDKVRSTSWE